MQLFSDSFDVFTSKVRQTKIFDLNIFTYHNKLSLPEI